MNQLNNLIHKILADKKLLLLVGLIYLLVYPLKHLTNARICEERKISIDYSSREEGKNTIMEKYFQLLCE